MPNHVKPKLLLKFKSVLNFQVTLKGNCTKVILPVISLDKGHVPKDVYYG